MSNWLTGIIVLLIVIILIDGFRRTWNSRRNRIDVSPALKKRMKMAPEPEPEEKEAPASYVSELPNGGARVIGHRDPLSIESKRRPSAREKKEARRREEAAKRTPEQTRLNLDESVPILMESVHNQTDSQHLENPFDKEHSDRIEPTLSNDGDDFEPNDPAQPLSATHDNHEDDEEYDAEDPVYHEDDAYDEDVYDEDAYEDEEYVDENEADDHYADDEDEAPVAAAPQSEPEEVLIINIMAHKGDVFSGNELLDIVIKCGLRYGSMDIFHRYSDTKGEGALLFSMANMVKPGTFDLDAMDEFTTPGVSLFMTLPIDADSMQSFDLMAETAQAISQTLGGELKDEQRSVMTRQTLEHCRQRIQDFERKKLFRRPR